MTFGLRGLANSYAAEGDISKAESAIDQAIAVTNDAVYAHRNIINTWSPLTRAMQELASQVAGLGVPGIGCDTIVNRYDRAAVLTTQIWSPGASEDFSASPVFILLSEQLDQHRKSRAACSPSTVAIDPQTDFCNLLRNILKSGPSGFSIYHGRATSSDGTSFEARVDLPNTSECKIDGSVFSCTYPEQDEKGTADRLGELEHDISTCKTLPGVIASHDREDGRTFARDIVILKSKDDYPIKLYRTFHKPNAYHVNGEWSITLDIEPVI